MDFDDRKILELFLGMIFVVLLVGIVLLAVYLPGSEGNSSVGTSNVISNSYNTNYYNYEKFADRNYYRDYENIKGYLDYKSYGEHSREKTSFGNYRDEFRVYVVNRDYVGGYFKVKFAFCDYYDNCFSETIEKYISSGDEKEFYYVDLHEGKHNYYGWSYRVFPEEI